MAVKIYIGLLFILTPILGLSQEETGRWLKKTGQFKIEPFVGLQLWSTYTFGEENFLMKLPEIIETVDNRLNFQIRRSRIGVKGEPYKNLKFNVTAALDLVGSDLLAGTVGNGNNGSSPQFRLWNAYIQWRVLPEHQKLYLTAGYMVLPIGRESTISALRHTSLEKAWSQYYLRFHLTGIGPGRAVGANVGGLFIEKERTVNWSYNVGLFNPVFTSYGGNSIGKKYAPLVVGRMTTFLGDPETHAYTMAHKVNYFGERRGLSIGLAGARQGETDLFQSNAAAGFDFLFNWDRLNIDGDWTYLWRTGLPKNNDLNQDRMITSATGYFRVSYNVDLKKRYILEPVFMVVLFNGEMDENGQEKASELGYLSGREQIIDLGLNFYFNPDLKLQLHYTLRDGDPGAAGAGASVNTFFVQKNLGPIRRGDWLGLGFVAVFK